MVIVNGFDISLSGKDRLVALLNSHLKMLELTSEATTILEVTTVDRSSANTKVIAHNDLNISMADAIAAGIKVPPKRLLERTIYMTRESGHTVHRRLGIPCLPLGLTNSATDDQIIAAVNTLYDLGFDKRDILNIERTNNRAKIVFRVSSITYTGYFMVDFTGEIS